MGRKALRRSAEAHGKPGLNLDRTVLARNETAVHVGVEAISDLAPAERLQVHLAFGDAELAELSRLCALKQLDAAVVLKMLELEQDLAPMGKRRGLRPKLRELVEGLAGGAGGAE